MKPFHLAGEHHAEAACLAFHPEGRLLATGGLDDRVVLWDVATGRRRRVFRGFGGMALSLAFLPKGDGLAVGGKGPIHLLDVEGGEEKGRLMAPEGFLYGLAADDGRLMAGGQDSRVRCWANDSDSLLWERQLRIGTVHGLALLPDDRALVIGESSSYVVLDRAGQPLAQVEGHRDTISTLATNAAGTWFATGADDGTVAIWSATSLRKVATHFLDDPATGLAFSPRHPLLAITCREGDLRLLDWRHGRMVRSEMDESERLTALQWSPDGAMLAGTRTDGGVRVWGRRPDAPKAADVGEAVPDAEIMPARTAVAAAATPTAVEEEPRADIFANPLVKWGAIALGVILLGWMVNGLLRNVNKGWRQDYDRARRALRVGDWDAAARPLGVLEGCCSSETEIAALLADYADVAWSESKAGAEAAIARQDWTEALDELSVVPGSRPAPPPWFSRLRDQAASGRLGNLEGLVRARSDAGRWTEARALLDESDGLARILRENPAWIAKGNSDTIVGVARNALARSRTARDAPGMRRAAGDVLQILPQDEDAARALWEASAQDGLPVAEVAVGTGSGIFSLAWDESGDRLLYGATGSVGGWILGASPVSLLETASGKPVYGLAPAVGGILVMDREGAGVPGGWNLAPHQVFSVFAATPDGAVVAVGEPEEKGVVVARQGEPGRDLSLPSNPTAVALGPDATLATALGRVVFAFSYERLEQMARIELGGTRNDVIRALAVLPGTPTRYVAGDNTGAVWLAQDEARLGLPLADSPGDQVSAIVAATDGRWFAVAAEERVQLRDASGALRGELEFGERVNALAAIGGGRGLAIAHGDTIVVLDMRNLPEVTP